MSLAGKVNAPARFPTHPALQFPNIVLRLAAFAALTISLLWFGGSARGANTLAFSSMSLATKVDLGEVTFTFHVTPSSKSANVGAQMYLHRSGESQWDFIQATTEPGGGTSKVFALYRGLSNSIEFTVDLPPGAYDGFRLLLFDAADGEHVDFGRLIYDTAADPANKSVHVSFKVISGQARVRGPQLVYAPYPDATPTGAGTYNVAIPAKVRMPQGYQAPDGGLWAMAKGTAGFSQVWVGLSTAQPANNALDSFVEAPVLFVIKDVRPGIWNLQFGLFKSSWGDALQWIYPGLDFEVGGDAWVVKATRTPARVRYMHGRFVAAAVDARPTPLYDGAAALQAAKFVRGANYGNAIGWTLQPALNTPGYFTLLGDIGCRFVRVVFNPDRYVAEPIYQHAVDQVVQNIWQANAYPLLAPQDLPKADTLAQRVERGQAVCRTMADYYKGKPVWLEVCNEPHEIDTWTQWKPVAERYVKTIRGIDPDAFVIVPFEGWSKDGRGAAKDPITDVNVDLYDGHAYVAPDEVQARFGTAARAGLPILIGEYGGVDPSYLSRMNRAFQAMSPQPAALAAWAFTVKGQDSLPLVESAQGAAIRYTPAGQAVAHAFNLWLEGKSAE